MRLGSTCLATLAVAATLAGCLGEDKETNYRAAGRDGSFAVGFAYDGQGVAAFEGWITIAANDADDSGQVLASGALNDEPWDVTFTHFEQAEGKDFQDGGIAADLVEHGASGNGDASIPRVQVEMAGWGEATIHAAGQVLNDPLTGEDHWVGHFMVITTGVRDNASGGIHKADHAEPYDPTMPDDGHAEPQDLEIHLVLKSHEAPPQEPLPLTPIQGQFGPTPHAETYNLVDNPYVGSRAALQLALSGQAAVNVNDMTRYHILDPTGDVVWDEADGTIMGSQAIELTLLEQGQYRFAVSGHVVGDVQYELSGNVQPPEQLVLNFWWEDVVLGDEAAAFASSLATGAA